MARRRPSAFRLLFGNVWALVCLVAAISCIVLALQLFVRTPPFDLPIGDPRVLLAIPALFGALAGLYGVLATAMLTARALRIRRLGDNLRSSQKRIQQLESLRQRQQARLDELSTLREVATIVNQETDFTLIAEKVLELIDGLLEPLESLIFLREDDKAKLEPLVQRREKKVLTGGRIRSRDIPDFDVSAFERHSIVCRVHGQELHAIVPMKVEEDILGVLFLAFPADSRPPETQTARFNQMRRTVLLEIAHHISLAVKTKHLQTKAVVDGLTRLYTRSHFNSQFQAAIELAQRSHEALSLILIDIDHFKLVNDTYGHATGDTVLARLAARIQRSLRKYDTAYRYGGEELAVLLPRTRIKDATGIAERLRALTEEQKFRSADGKLVRVTVSLGVAQLEPADDCQSLFERCDRRLYRAKTNGRNQVVPAAA